MRILVLILVLVLVLLLVLRRLRGLERSVENRVCPLVVVRISFLLIRKDFVGLLDLSRTVSDLPCRYIYVMRYGKRLSSAATMRAGTQYVRV